MDTASEPSRGSIGPSDGFTVEAKCDPPRMTLAPRGELDLATVPSLEREIDSLPWPQLTELVFDLSGLMFIDSTGLSVLIRAAQRAATAGVRFSVIRASEQARTLFTIAGVTDSLNLQS